MRMLLAATIVLGTSAITYAAPPRVDVVLDECLGPSRDEILRVTRIELGDALSDPAAPGENIHASIACAGPVAVLRVDDPSMQRTLWRRIDLVTGSEPRLLALALVELVASLRAELYVPPPSSPPPAAVEHVAPSLATAVAPTSAIPRYRIELTGGAMTFSADKTALAGLGARLSSRGRMPWLIDVQAHHGSNTTPIGEVTIDVSSLGAALAIERTARSVRASFGAGLRGGVVRMTGTPSSAIVMGSTTLSAWFGPIVLGDIAVPLTGRLALAAAVEVGYVVAPVSAFAGDRRAASVDGAWAQLHVGVGYSL
ncbi:MAG TPA: hypothetical protein VFV99_31865 [Kofleriaceae bacterium]|nr:hypothetical protein [Kofleriaceae bacterium]